MTGRRVWKPAVVAFSAAALSVAVASGIDSTLRTVLALWFLGACPGLAFIGLLRLRDPWMEASLTLALSFSIDVLISAAVAYGMGWSADLALLLIVAVSLIGAGLQITLPPAVPARSS